MPNPLNFPLVIRPGATFFPVVFRALDVANNAVPLEGYTPFAEVRVKPRDPVLMSLGIALAPTGDVGTVTVVAATDLFTSTAHGLVAGEIVQFSTSGTLPGGLNAFTDYYVIGKNLAANTFMVSELANGASVDITDAGTGTHTVSIPPGQVILAEITDENTHDMDDFTGLWDLMLEDTLGRRDAPYVSGSFNVTAGITNPAE